jgi:DNA repair protein RadD
MSEIKLRNYQLIGGDKIVEWLYANPAKNCLGCFITGSGKSLILAYIIRKILMNNPRKRFLVLTSTKELVMQDELALLSLWNTAPSAVFCAGLKRKEMGQITFATIGSIAKHAHTLGSVDYVLIDEIQTVSHNENTQYRKFLNVIKELNPDNQVVGVTATPFRMNGGSLLDDHIFDEMAINMTDYKSFNWFLEQAYVAQLTTKRTATQLDTTGVKVTRGDFNEHDLQKAVDKVEISRAALAEAVRYGHDRKSWIVFGTGIDHCTHLTEMLNEEFGISAVMVHSKMSDQERDDNIAGFKSGKYRACVNNIVLLVGFDHREIDLIIDLQPTSSTGRHQQKYGRGLRIAPKAGMPLDTKEERLAAIAAGNKPNGCLILDYSSNTYRNGFVNLPNIPGKKGKGGGKQILKTCPECATMTYPSVRYCPDCGHEFVFEVKIENKATASDVIATDKHLNSGLVKQPKPKLQQPDDNWYDIWHVAYTKHINRTTGVPMLKVSYNPSGLDATEWVGFENEHGSWQRKAAYAWWSKRIIGDMPKTVDEALLYVSQLPTPKRAFVKSSKGYLNVSKVEFEDGLVIQPLVEVEPVTTTVDWDEDLPF